MSFAERLTEAFDGASMAEIARRLGVPHSTVRNYIQQNRLPAADVLIEIANSTNVSLNWLLTGTGERSADSRILSDLRGMLDDAHVKSIEELRLHWEKKHGQKTSWDDFLQILITWGGIGVRHRDFEDKFKADIKSLEYSVNRKSILAQSIVEIIRHEITDGDLRDVILNVVRAEINVQDLGTVDEFDVAAAIGAYHDPHRVMSEWFRFEQREPPADYGVMFADGWETYSLQEKIDALRDAKKVLDRTLRKKAK